MKQVQSQWQTLDIFAKGANLDIKPKCPCCKMIMNSNIHVIFVTDQSILNCITIF